MVLTPSSLKRKILKLRATLPHTSAFERALTVRGLWNTHGVWYRSQKEHWIGWLSEYNGPGYYGRSNWRRSAEFIYNHIVCPPMVLWLGEAVGIPETTVRKAKRAALLAGPRLPAQCAAIRRVVPWEMIQTHLVANKTSAAHGRSMNSQGRDFLKPPM